MTKTLLSLAFLLLSSAAAPAHAFLWGKKEQVTCSVFTAPRGAGKQAKDLPPALLRDGRAAVATTVDLYVGRQLYMRGAKVAGSVVTDAQGRRVMDVVFRDAQSRVFKSGRMTLRTGAWTTFAWDAWPKSTAHLDIQCLVEKAK